MTGEFSGLGTLQFTTDNKYCYAYNHFALPTDGSYATMLLFETNSEYLVCDLTMSASIGGNFTTGFQDIFLISFNDIEIAAFKLDSAEEDMPTAFVSRLIIPPFTTVKIECKSSVNNVAWKATVGLTGKVHGAIEQENLESITDNNKWASL